MSAPPVAATRARKSSRWKATSSEPFLPFVNSRTGSAFVFPGQGSQQVGMGRDVAAAFPAAREVFEAADELAGYRLSQVCFDGPADTLNQTRHTQPAVFVTSIAILRALQAALPDARPLMVAGHSFGQITALVAVGAMRFADGLALARERGRLMDEADSRAPGGMIALLGPGLAAVRQLVERARAQSGGVLVVANDNCPGQSVISGDEAGLAAALALAPEIRARRSVRLPISIAAHSPLMAPVNEEFAARVRATAMQAPAVPVYGNLEAAPLRSVAANRAGLEGQLTGAVRWRESVQNMIADGATRFLEIGPGTVLTGLLRRIDRKTPGLALHSAEALQQFIDSSR